MSTSAIQDIDHHLFPQLVSYCGNTIYCLEGSLSVNINYTSTSDGNQYLTTNKWQLKYQGVNNQIGGSSLRVFHKARWLHGRWNSTHTGWDWMEHRKTPKIHKRSKFQFLCIFRLFWLLWGFWCSIWPHVSWISPQIKLSFPDEIPRFKTVPYDSILIIELFQ